MVPVHSPILTAAAHLPAWQRRAHTRLLWTLFASAAAHLWMAGGNPLGAIRMTAPLPVHWIEARLDPVAADHDLLQPAADAADVQRAGPGADEADGRRDAVPVAPAAKAQHDARSRTSDREDATPALPAAPAPADPVYYSARELEIYPAPLAPLRFEYPAYRSEAGIGGDVVVRLLLDEAGKVDEATVVAAQPSGHFDERARAKLAAARFSPGRRGGRAVKSQLTVRVSFEPAAREEALR